MLRWLVSSWHDDVAIWATLELEFLCNFVPRDKLLLSLIDQVLLGGVLARWINIEADHATDKVHANLLLPCILGAS